VPVHSPIQSASFRVLKIARQAQHAARKLSPVLTPRLGVLANLGELPAVGWALASLVGASPSTHSERRVMVLSPLQSASCLELNIARNAQHAARQLSPVLAPRLGLLVNLDELAALGWALASLVAASPSRRSERRVRVHSPLQSASLNELIIARLAQHAARQLSPVLAPRLGVLVNLMELAALGWVPASLVAAPPMSRSKRCVLVLSPLKSASLNELIIARLAQHAARKLPPVLTPGLLVLVNLIEMAADGWAPASLVAASNHALVTGLFPQHSPRKSSLSKAFTLVWKGALL